MSKPVIPEEIFESELARLRAEHHVHDAARIIADAVPYFDPSEKVAYGSIIEALFEVEKRLAELERVY
jgi:glycerol dehydrogenase-like iron-containing ADH family enzyme